MATYLFPAALLLFCVLLGLINLVIPQVISGLIILVGIFAAWAIIKINEG